MAVDYSGYSKSRGQALAQLNDARKRKAEAEADARIASAQADARKSSDADNLLNIGVQATAAVLTQGTSLAFAPQMNQMLMGDKQGWSRDLANVGSMAYSLSEGNKARGIADADRMFSKNQAADERTYQMLLNSGAYGLAADKALDMKNNANQYEKDRKRYKEEGFLSHLIDPQRLILPRPDQRLFQGILDRMVELRSSLPCKGYIF